MKEIDRKDLIEMTEKASELDIHTFCQEIDHIYKHYNQSLIEYDELKYKVQKAILDNLYFVP